MKYNEHNLGKVIEALETANLPKPSEIVEVAEVAQWSDIRNAIEVSRTAKDAALMIALQYGVQTIEFWEPIPAEDFAERLSDLLC